MKKSAIIISIVFTAQLLFAQSAVGSMVLQTAFIAVLLFILVIGVIFVADSLMQVEGKEMGSTNDDDNEFSIFPSFGSNSGTSIENGKKVIKLKKGHNILLEGEAAKEIEDGLWISKHVAVKPKDFIGMSPIPKVVVEVGQEVKVGDVLFFDKKRPEIKYVSPVSGEVASVVRGAKRSINEVVILADKEMKYCSRDAFDVENADRQALINHLLSTGLWPNIRQRPYNMVPDPQETPRDIFISTFDSAPLAPDNSLIVAGEEAAFQKGLDILNKLTDGTIFLGLGTGASAFEATTGVEKVYFNGPHPSGNVGVQIHHIKPINKGEVVWTLNVQSVLTIGRFFLTGNYDASRVVVLAGAEVSNPKYYRTVQGANVGELVNGKLNNDHVRFISGDVLSGKTVARDNYLGFYDDQITVIEEGDKYEMFGWLLPLTPRPSISKTFPQPKDFKYKVNTNTHGEKRAFVVTGQYEKVLPMDIYPQQLFKAILVNDFERMEGLGIYELAEEDVALCEFACTSKQPLQKILAEGLETMREQG